MTATYREVCLQTKGNQCHICDSTRNVVVHHVNGDRSDNRMENLVPMCESCHRKIHDGIEGYEEWTAKLPNDEETSDSRQQTTWRADEELLDSLDDLADKYSMSRNAAITMLVRDGLEDK